jgi:ABC-type molybdate transport system substrate-binding protein
MSLKRRDLSAAVLVLVPAVATAAPSTAPDVVVYCDRALRRAMEATGRLFTVRTGARIHVFCAAPPLMLAQIERVTQNDVLVTLDTAMDEASRRKLVQPETRIPLGANRLVLASQAASGPPATDPAAIARLIGKGPLAAPDPTRATTIDSVAVLAGIGLAPPPFPLVGAIDTETVAALTRRGNVPLGLMYRTETGPGSDLSVVALLPEAPRRYGAAISVVTRSPSAQAFMTFLRSREAAASLSQAGLEGLT